MPTWSYLKTPAQMRIETDKMGGRRRIKKEKQTAANTVPPCFCFLVSLFFFTFTLLLLCFLVFFLKPHFHLTPKPSGPVIMPYCWILHVQPSSIYQHGEILLSLSKSIKTSAPFMFICIRDPQSSHVIHRGWRGGGEMKASHKDNCGRFCLNA